MDVVDAELLQRSWVAMVGLEEGGVLKTCNGLPYYDSKP
jgi:hypothetical protein